MSKEKRERIKEAVLKFYPKLSLRQIARAFGVSVETVRRIRKKLVDTDISSSRPSDEEKRKEG